jgi:hypothetical protein
VKLTLKYLNFIALFRKNIYVFVLLSTAFLASILRLASAYNLVNCRLVIIHSQNQLLVLIDWHAFAHLLEILRLASCSRLAGTASGYYA